MSETGLESTTHDASPQREATIETRVDAAHLVRDRRATVEAPEVESVTAELVVDLTLEQREQLRIQAAQLAAQLQSRQRDLDRRESQLNAGNAELENQRRGARLWLIERQQELAEREAELEGRAADLEASHSAIQAAEEYQAAARIEADKTAAERERALHERAAQLDLREARLEQQTEAQRIAQRDVERARAALECDSLHARQQLARHREASLELVRLGLAGLERRRQAIESRAVEVERLATQPSPQQLALAEKLASWKKELDARTDRLDADDALFQQAHAELAAAQQKLHDDRCRLDEQTKAGRLELAQLQRQGETELAERKKKLLRREQELIGRRAALEQLRDDLNRVHRETLEMRLATEELWAQMAGSLAPSVMNKSLARVRAKLAEHFQAAQENMLQTRTELETLRIELGELQEELDRKTNDLHRWAQQQQNTLQEQARQLGARELEVRRHADQQRQSEHEWVQQRRAYQQEIRRLVTALRGRQTSAA